jgi:hypothetical protein
VGYEAASFEQAPSKAVMASDVGRGNAGQEASTAAVWPLPWQRKPIGELMLLRHLRPGQTGKVFEATQVFRSGRPGVPLPLGNCSCSHLGDHSFATTSDICTGLRASDVQSQLHT